jgi:PIN domain nuclease of toxin-antitoxin system
MGVLLDTHLLVWAMGSPERLPAALVAMLQEPASGRTSLQYVECFGETPSATALNARSAQR